VRGQTDLAEKAVGRRHGGGAGELEFLR
jgi:hypothetical protein